MNKGVVYLVGAGPGDIGLITVKGLECLKKADVVVYDRLANPRLLSYCKPDVTLIYVGKTPDHHTLKQEEINQVLVEQGLTGKTVVRLKGGDPYVFGRGGEEAEQLRAAGIRFEVVPGITSAIAAPSYAGIPVTHRHLTSTFTVITGHEDPTKPDTQISWQRLATDPGTLIFLMGVGNLPDIIAQLTKGGKDVQTPVALVRWGTRPEQQVVTGTMENIVAKVEEAGLTSPAIILVGDVVNMRETLSWFEQKPLFGKRILVTRAREQASVLSDKIEEAGGEAWEAPMIAITEPLDKSPLDAAIQQIGTYQWIVFTSVNAVHYFFAEMKALGQDVRALAGVKLCAIGPKTAQALEDKGLLITVMPETFVAEAVIEALRPHLEPGGKVLLPRSDLARQILVDALRELQQEVTEVHTYRTITAEGADNALLERLEDKSVHMVTFASSSTVHNFMKLIGDRRDLLEGIAFASIGPITSATASEYGLSIAIEAEIYTIDGLFEAILAYYDRP